MKRHFVFSQTLLFALVLLFTSCQKDELLTPRSEDRLQNTSAHWEDYDRFGPILEDVLSEAVTDPNFAFKLIDATQQRPTGDFELLLKDFVAMDFPNQTLVKDLLLQFAGDKFTAEDLDAFLQSYPSTVIAVRGNPISWLKKEHVPPVKFVSSRFDHQAPRTLALQKGNPVELDLTQPFQHAVVAVHISERHDATGQPLRDRAATRPADRIAPNVHASDLSNATPLGVAMPEPTICPSPLPLINSFTATASNGGITLEYNISNFSSTLGSWGRVRIHRLNPDNSVTSFLRYANQPNIFIDNTGSPNIEYTYTIDAYVAYIEHPSGIWVKCEATNNLQTTKETYPGAGPSLNTYRGTNISSSTIRYDWTTPATAVNEYRIQRSTNSGYQTIATLPGTATSFFYSYPGSDKGNKVETRIQYRAAGFWTGNYWDGTYGSFRDPGQPFYYYGLRMDDVTAYEYGESPLFGAPEIRLTALQASATETTITLENTMIEMKACTRRETVYEYIPWWGWVSYEANVNTGYFYPEAAPNGYLILPNWQADLSGSAIRIITKETDVAEAVITEQTNTTSYEQTLSAKFGLKIEEIFNIDLGVTSTWKDASEIKIRYPVDDIDLGDRIIYYHDHPTTIRGFELFGDIDFEDNCQNLMTHL